SGPVALVFGPEATGLTSEEVSRCHFLLTIPADEAYPVLNIAQAAAICLYELFQAKQMGGTAPRQELATVEEQERLFESLQQALTEIHFLWDERAPAQMHAIRHLLGRAQLSPMEAKLLMGVARQLRWYVERHPPSGHVGGEPEGTH